MSIIDYEQVPYRRTIASDTNGVVRIVKPADPAKIAAYRAVRKTIGKRRVKAGLSRRGREY